MNIGIPKEIKNNESRVGMTPAGVFALTKKNHTVFVQATAGEGSGSSGGGGGAGGFREVKTPITPYTASPLDGYGTPGNRVTVTAQSYDC